MNKFVYTIKAAALMTLLPLLLVGCGAIPIDPAPSAAKLDNDATQIRDLTVVIWLGGGVRECIEQSVAYSTKFRMAMKTRFPAIFEENGIHIAQTIEENAPIQYERLSSGNLSLPLLNRVKTSHTLVLIAEEFSYPGSCGPNNNLVSVKFDARLWDNSKKHPVWSARPSLQLVVTQPLLRTQFFAGSILAAMHKDGLIKLKTDVPVDLDGKPISAKFVWAEDR